MGIAVPRPQMRGLEARTIKARLDAYDAALASGKSTDEAKQAAYAITKKTVAAAERKAKKARA